MPVDYATMIERMRRYGLPVLGALGVGPRAQPEQPDDYYSRDLRNQILGQDSQLGANAVNAGARIFDAIKNRAQGGQSGSQSGLPQLGAPGSITTPPFNPGGGLFVSPPPVAAPLPDPEESLRKRILR